MTAHLAILSACLVALVPLLPAASTATSPLAEDILAAEDALRRGETQLAESRYRDALLDAWMLLGACDALEDDLDGARDAFERATRQALELRRPAIALSTVETRLGEADAAIRRLRRLLARQPEDVTLRRLLARTLSFAGREAEAVQELEEARAVAPDDGDDAELAFALATGHLRLGDEEEAARLFSEVTAARPLPQTHVLVGRTWRDFEHYERARVSFRRALEMDPEVRRARFYLGTVELLDEGRGALEDALAQFRGELEIAPDDPLARLFLGLALVEVRRFEDALPHLERAARESSTRLDALHYRGRALLGLGRHAEAEPPLRRALELAGASTSPHQLAGLHYQLALALRALGRHDEARPHFDAAREQMAALGEASREQLRRYLEDAPDADGPSARSSLPVPTGGLEALSPGERAETCRGVAVTAARAHLNLGVVQARAGRQDQAAARFRDALAAARHPAEPIGDLAARARYSLGVALFGAGRHAEAREPLERSWETSPTPTLRRVLAMTRLETEDWQGAAELLAGDPDLDADPSLLYAYGKALVRSGRADEALGVFGRLSAGGAESPELLVLLGEAHAREGDWARAEESLRRALELDAPEPDTSETDAPEPDTSETDTVAGAHRLLGELHMRRGELGPAEAELRAELTLHPRDHRARFLLATVLDLAEKPDEAEEAVRRVLDERPRDADVRYLLGKILLGRGDAEAAAAQLEAARDAAPSDFNVRYQLALAYQRLGRRDAAREQFDAYRELKAAERGNEP